MYNFYFFFLNNYLYYRFSLPLKILVKKRIFEKGRLVYCSYLPLEEQKCLFQTFESNIKINSFGVYTLYMP